MFYTYVLKSQKDRFFYIGFTNDLRKRFYEHNKRQVDATKDRTPFKIIYYEACLDESDARRREKYLKTTQGSRLIKRRIKDYLYISRKI